MLSREKIKCVVFDLDGTIYFGKNLSDNANELILLARENYKNVFFATNNSARTREQLFDKLTRLGVNLTKEEIINSGYLAANYIVNNKIGGVYCFGTDDLKNDLAGQGVNIISENPSAMVIGYNPDFKMEDLETAVNVYLKSKKCLIIAANIDRVYPKENGIIAPGAGPIVKAFEYAVNKTADVIIGKPSAMMLKIIADKFNLVPDNILMVGDRIESDIKMADEFGAQSLLISQKDKCSGQCNVAKDLYEAAELIKK